MPSHTPGYGASPPPAAACHRAQLPAGKAGYTVREADSLFGSDRSTRLCLRFAPTWPGYGSWPMKGVGDCSRMNLPPNSNSTDAKTSLLRRGVSVRWGRRAGLAAVALWGLGNSVLAQQSGEIPTQSYRPASHAGVPAPLVPLQPPSQRPPASLGTPRSDLSVTAAKARTVSQELAPGVTSQPAATPEPFDLSRPQTDEQQSGRAGSAELDFRDLGSQAEERLPDLSRRKQTIETSGRIEVVKQHYPDGKVQIEREVTQDLEGNYFNHGYWRLYGPTGQTLADGVFQYGLMEGPWSRWHPAQPEGLFRLRPFNLFRGPFLSTVTFVGGKLDGVWTISDSSQRKIMEVAYREGKRHGLSAWYYPDSSRMREQYFNEGVLDGTLTEWDERGRETRRDEYVKGRRVITDTTTYRPQQKKSEITYLDPLLELAGPDDWWEATPAAFKSVGKRVEHGPCGTWYENGQPQMQGQYQNGKRVGQWTWWHPNGMKQLAGRFEDDKKVGQWTWWHTNGLKAIEGNYQSDAPAGIWNWWDEQGQKTDTRNYQLEANDSENPDVELLDLDDQAPEEAQQPPLVAPGAAPPTENSQGDPAEGGLRPGESELPGDGEMEEIPLELPPSKDGNG